MRKAKRQQRGDRFHPYPALPLIIHPNGCTTKQPTHTGGQLLRTFVPPHDGTRYYDLSQHSQAEANQLAPALVEFGNLPARLPDQWWLYPDPPKQLDLLNP